MKPKLLDPDVLDDWKYTTEKPKRVRRDLTPGGDPRVDWQKWKMDIITEGYQKGMPVGMIAKLVNTNLPRGAVKASKSAVIGKATRMGLEHPDACLTPRQKRDRKGKFVSGVGWCD